MNRLDFILLCQTPESRGGGAYWARGGRAVDAVYQSQPTGECKTAPSHPAVTPHLKHRAHLPNAHSRIPAWADARACCAQVTFGWSNSSASSPWLDGSTWLCGFDSFGPRDLLGRYGPHCGFFAIVFPLVLGVVRVVCVVVGDFGRLQPFRNSPTGQNCCIACF